MSISSGSSQAERNPSWPKSCQATMRFRSLAWIWTRRSRRRTTDVTTLPQGMSDYLSITLLILLRCLPPNHSWYKRLSFFRVVMTPWFNIFSHFVLCPTAVLHEMLQASDLAFCPLVFFTVRCLAVFPLLRAFCKGRVSTKPVPMPWPGFPMIFESLG